MNIDKSRHRLAMFEALFVTVQEVLLKQFLTISTIFIKLADIYTVITP